MNILIFSFCRLGDTLVMLPLLHWLRQRWPEARILLLSQAEGAGQFVGASAILEGRGLVDEFLSFPVEGGWLARQSARLRLAWQLRRRGLALGLVGIPPAPPLEEPLLRNMVRFLRFTGARQILAPTQILQAAPGERLPKAADELLSLLSPLGFGIPGADEGDFSLPVHEAHAREAEVFVREFPQGRIPVALAVGGNRLLQRWPLERYAEVARRLSAVGCHPVLFGGPADVPAMETVRGDLPGTIVTAPIAVSAEVLRHCAFYVGNDTGVMHLACAVGLKCVALFSARAVPGVWEPYGKGHVALLPHVPCEGCNLADCNQPSLCILQHTVEDVWNACQSLFEKKI